MPFTEVRYLPFVAKLRICKLCPSVLSSIRRSVCPHFFRCPCFICALPSLRCRPINYSLDTDPSSVLFLLNLLVFENVLQNIRGLEMEISLTTISKIQISLPNAPYALFKTTACFLYTGVCALCRAYHDLWKNSRLQAAVIGRGKYHGES